MTVLILFSLVIILLVLSVRIAQEYQRAVVFRVGRVTGLRGPGLFLLMPVIERSVMVDLRTKTKELDTQETVTRDGVAVKVNAVLWYKAIEPIKTVIEVQAWDNAVKQAAETSMRDTIGQNDLDQLLKAREQANATLKRALGAAVAPWGVQIEAVELKDLDIPENMQRAIAREAEAVREKRARIIKAEGELDASAKLSQAARAMSETPGALELRRLQALTEIGAEHNSTIIVNVPTDVAGTGMTAAVARAAAGPDRPPG